MSEPSDVRPEPPGAPDGPRLIGGRYRLGPVIGRGGMATIHRATDVRLERDVAVKLLRPEVSRDPDLAQRFRREALAATVLRHPNIVACLDTGTDGDQPYLVMDLVDGEDLAARLKRGGRLAPWQVARIGLDVARGLGVAHVRGIVHRDVKPGNILLAADGRAMVTDFGIARLAIDAEASLPGTTLGSVPYFSPEQARGTTTTPASDVYGLGLVLYEALTGARAWSGDTTDALALARVDAAPPAPRDLVPTVPAALEAIVMRAMAPDPADRFPNGGAMAAALEPIVAAGDPSTPTAVVSVPVAAAAPVGTAPPLMPPTSAGAVARPPSPAPVPVGRGRGTRPLGAFVALAVVGGLLGAVLVAALPGATGPTDPTDAPIGAATARPSATAGRPTATPRPTPDPTPTPEPTRTPEPTEAPTAVPAGEVADLCESFFGIPCGLGPGRYAPARFSPAFDIELGEGWSNALHEPTLVALTRDEGLMTFATDVREVYPAGSVETPRQRSRDLIEAFIATQGVSARRPADVRIDGRRGLSVDLTPIDSARIALFATASSTFYLEPDRTTRVVVMDVRSAVVVLAIEPTEASDLRAILDVADPAAGTIRWR